VEALLELVWLEPALDGRAVQPVRHSVTVGV
jgi:hypothetical protein